MPLDLRLDLHVYYIRAHGTVSMAMVSDLMVAKLVKISTPYQLYIIRNESYIPPGQNKMAP